MPSLPDPYFPERGDAVWVSFNPQSGHEHAGGGPPWFYLLRPIIVKWV